MYPPEVRAQNEKLYVNLKKKFVGVKKGDDYRSHSGKVHSISWNCTGTKIASCSSDKSVSVFEFDGTRLSRTPVSLRAHSDSVDQVAWCCKNADLLVSASADKSIRLWDCRNLSSKTSPVTLPTKGENINLCWNPTNTNQVLVGNKEDLISVFDIRTQKSVVDQQFRFEINEICFNNSGNLLFLTTGNGTVLVQSFPDMKLQSTIKAHSSSAICVKMSPDGKYFATGGADAVVCLFDYSTFVCVSAVSRLDWVIRVIGFNHDSRLLAAGSEDTFIDVSFVPTSDSVGQVSLDNPPANALCWHPKANILAYGADDKERDREYGSIKLVNIENVVA